MTKVLTINFLAEPYTWLLAELKAGELRVLSSQSITCDPQLEASDRVTYALGQLALQLRLKNISYDLLHAAIDINPEISIDLEMPFSDEKALQAIIYPELEDRLPIEPENFFVHFRAGQELSPGRFQVHTNLCQLEPVTALIKEFRDAGLRPNLITNQAGINSLLSNAALGIAENFCLINFHGVNCNLSGHFENHLFIEENIAPILGSSSPEDLDKNLTFRLKQLKLQYENLKILSLNQNAADRLQGLGFETELLDLTKMIPRDLEQHNQNNLALALAAEPNLKIKPAFNLCFGRFANKQITISLIDGFKKILPSLAIFITALLLGLIAYFSVQAIRIDKIKTALSTKILQNLERSDLLDVEQVVNENSILEEQLKTLGAPTGLNPADFFVQLSSDLHKETEIKFNRLRINDNKAILEGLAPSYTAIDKVERILKKNSRVYCNINKRSSGAGSSPSFVIEVELCPK